MGVLNVTPDSFSDGGLFPSVDSAVRRAMEMVEEGADIIDIGGESTRPATFNDGAPLDIREELSRVLPVIERLRAESPNIPISIDTYKADVARNALNAGANIINDISGLSYDPEMAKVAADLACPVVIMHLLGQPRNIGAPVYGDIIADITLFFERQITFALASGIDPSQIILDPGIGFGKNAKHNLTILRRLREFKALGCPLLIGPSRKAFIGHLLNDAAPQDRAFGTAAAIALSIAGGADIIRVHDVKEMAQVAKVADAIVSG